MVYRQCFGSYAKRHAIMSENIDTEKRDLELAVDGDAASKNEANLNADSKNEIVEIDHVAEKKLMRKIDLNLITLFGVRFRSGLSFSC